MAAYHKNSKVFLLQTWLKHFLTSRQKMSMSMAVNVLIFYQKHLMLLQQTQLKKFWLLVKFWGICCLKHAWKCSNIPLNMLGFGETNSWKMSRHVIGNIHAYKCQNDQSDTTTLPFFWFESHNLNVIWLKCQSGVFNTWTLNTSVVCRSANMSFCWLGC